VHGATDTPERPVGQATAFTQLVNQQDEDVEVSHAAETLRQLSQPTAKLPHNGLFELQDREELAEAPGGDSGAVHCTDLTRLNAG
jgi:hypothetical protein